MKKQLLFLSLAFVAFFFASCEKESVKEVVVTFEDVQLNEQGISDTVFVSNDNITFRVNNGAFWNGGIVASNHTDSVTTGYENQYSSITGTGANKSAKYAVVYQPGYIFVDQSKEYEYSIKSIMVTNSTYAYFDMKNGSLYSKQFVSGDWFKMIITAYNNGVQKSSVEYYLADFRDGKTVLLNSWEKVDVSALGAADKYAITFASSDNGDWGMNTPAYVCIDNIVFEQNGL
jgi:hypothetical protein